MHKINTDTAVGYEFVDGDADAGVRATRLNASWFNTVQRELCNIVEQAGMALSENDDGQVLRAVLELVLRTLSAGLLKQIKLKGGYTIEIDSDNGTISIFDPEGSAGISFGFNGGSEFSFTDDVSFEGCVDIMGGAKVGGDLDVKDSDGNGVQITRTGIKLKNADGSESTTKMERGLVATDRLEADSAKIASLLSVLDGAFVVKSNEARSKVKTIIQNEMSVTRDLEVQGFLKSADGSFIRAHSESFIQLPFVDASTEADLKNPSAIIGSQILKANPLKGDIVMVRNMSGDSVEFRYSSTLSSDHGVVVVAAGESILYAYNGSYWSKVW